MSPSGSESSGRRKAKERRREQRLARRQTQQEQLQAFGEQVLEQQRARGRLMTLDPADETRMAAVLEAFVEPYLAVADTEDMVTKLFGLAAVAWNASFYEEDQRRETLDEILSDIMPGAPRRERERMQVVMAQMIKRRKLLFSEHNRIIVSYKLHEIGQDLHLTVASMPFKPKEG